MAWSQQRGPQRSATPPTPKPTPAPKAKPKANNGSTPTLPDIQWGTSGSTTVKWPSATYMISLGVEPKVAYKWAGKAVDMSGFEDKTPANYARAITEALGVNTANAQAFWSPWTRQGFDYKGYLNADSKVSRAYRNQTKTFFPDILHQGWDKVDSTLYTMTDRGASKAKTPATIIDPNTGKETTVQVDSTKQSTAYGTIQNELARWGLDDLTDAVFNKVFKDGISDAKQLTNFVRSTKEYKNNFQGMAEYNANPDNVQKITEQQYLLKAQAYMNTAQQYGLPDSFFTRKEIGQLVAGGVSPAEFNRRVVNGYLTAMNADPATRQALAAQGVDFGHLLAYYLDPKRAEPMLTDRTNQAQLQGYAQNAGIANLTPTMAQDLTQRTKSNLNPDGTFSSAEEKQALDVAAQGQGLTAVAPGSNAQTVDTTQLIGTKLAGFGGTTQVEAQQATQKALQGQEAPFQKAGGYATTPQGVTGIGSSPQ